MSATGDRLEQLTANAGAGAQDAVSEVAGRGPPSVPRGRGSSEQAFADGADAATRLHTPGGQAANLGADAAGISAADRAAAERAAAPREHMPNSPKFRGIILRATANVALAAAIGIICKKRFAEHVEP